MCCFSGQGIVEEVKNTWIFARLGEHANQTLIYSMSMNARADVAMVLPIPVKPGTEEDGLRFFDFSKYKDVFTHLNQCFPSDSKDSGAFGSAPLRSRSSPLKVVTVGAYDASFVPQISALSRLDERFRLPESVWSKLPGYTPFGFAVFKLRQGRHDVHPMAFSFPTARPGSVFFPTLRIHDGKVHEDEHFDHTLYLQGANLQMAPQWQESPGIAVQKVKCGLTHGMIRPEMHVYRRRIIGKFPNGDIVVRSRNA
jgi:hypothetical protein